MLAFSVSTAPVGTVLTINGSNFLGAGSITITAQSPQNGQRLITTVAPLDNGSFSVPFTPTVRDVGTVTVHASSASEGGAQSAISVSSKLKVVAAATATPTLAPTPTTSISLGGGTSTSNGSGASPTAIVLVVVAILFALLAIAGVVIFMLIRRRGANGGPDGEDPGYYGQGPQPTGYGSYDQTAYGGAVYGNDPTGAYSSQGQFGRSGFQDMNRMPPDQQVGGVAMWDDQQFGEEEDDAGPGPDWHPRPMTGHWRTPDASNLRSGGGYNPGVVDPRDAAGFAPPDPWANRVLIPTVRVARRPATTAHLGLARERPAPHAAAQASKGAIPGAKAGAMRLKVLKAAIPVSPPTTKIRTTRTAIPAGRNLSLNPSPLDEEGR